MATATPYPEIRSLSREECEQVLARHHVGRIAFTFRDRVDIQPVHYALDGESLYVRTSEGHKLTMLTHNPWMAMEVDDVHGPFDWVSVVAYGTAYRIDAGGPAENEEAERRAVELLRELVPGMYTAADPVPHRQALLRIAIRELSGRRATSTWTQSEGRDTSSY